MKKLSFKWKLFLIANYVQMIVFLLLFASLMISIVTMERYSDDNALIPQVLFGTALILVALNSSLNLHILYRNFPDKALPSKNKTVLIVSWVINLLLSAGLLLIIVYGFIDEYDNRYQRYDRRLLILILGFFILWLIGLYILILQVQISGYLSRNNKKKMSTLIDSIGDDKP